MTPDEIIEQEKARANSRSSAPRPTPDDIIAGEKSRLANSASGAFYTTRETQPDRASKVISLASQLGAKPDFVDRNLEAMEETQAEQERQGVLSKYPAVARFFSDPYRAAEGKDSVVSFAEIERIRSSWSSKKKRGWLEAPFSQAGDLGRTAASVAPQMVGSVTRGTGDLLGGYVGFMRNQANKVPGLREGLAEIDRVEQEIAPQAKILAPQNYLRRAGQGAADLAEVIRPEQMGFEDKVVDALGQIAAAVATTAVTKNPNVMAGAFMGMGADQQGQSMRDAGLDPDQMLPELVAGAGVTGLSEQMRLGSIMRMIPKEARERVVSKAVARIAGQAGEEAIQEATEGVLQNLITTTYDADASLFEGIAEQAATAGTASAIFQAVVEVALPGKSRGVRAESNANELMELRDVIEQAPVFQRSRESIQAFLEQAGEGDTVLLHGEDLVELYQSDPEVFLQRMDEVGLSEEDISRAMDGHDIEVEAAKVLSVSEGFEDWVKIAKADEDTPTLREMERQVEDSDAIGAVDFTEAFERFSEQDQALEGFERVQGAVTEQLLGAGRTRAEAEAAGTVWGAMFRQLAEAGVDEGAVFERLGLDVRGPNTPKEPRIAKPQEPQTLHSFVRGLGGIRESFGEDGAGFLRGEVDSRLGERVPGLINNASGATLDEIFRAATEEGGYDIRDTQELLDLIEQDLSGERVYPLGEGEVYAAELEAYEAQFAVPDGEVMEQANEDEVDLDALIDFADRSIKKAKARAAEEALKSKTDGGSLTEYPAAIPPEYEFSNFEEVGGKIVMMTPDQFLGLASELRVDQESRENISDLAQMMLDGRKIDPPRLSVNVNGGVDSHDGRHRALAARRLGIESLPVLLTGDSGGAFPSEVKTIRSQAGASDRGFAVVLNQAAQAGYEGQDTGEAREWLEAKAAGLDMSQEARMARAQEMGFDTDTVLYHGTPFDFEGFKLGQEGSGGSDQGMAVFLTTDTKFAGKFAGATRPSSLDGSEFGAPRVMPTFVRGRMKQIAPESMEAFDGEFSDTKMRIAIESARNEGFDGLYIPNMRDSGLVADQIVIFDPSNIRSVNAAFNPAHSDSANLLHQSAPRSLRAAMKMAPEDRAEWYDKQIEVTKSGRNTTLSIKPDTAGLIFDDVQIVISDGINVDFTMGGKFHKSGGKYSGEDIAKGARVMSQVTVALQEYMLRNEVPFMSFMGATPAHNRLYESMLKRFDFEGYSGYKTTSTQATLLVDADGVKQAEGDPFSQPPALMVIKDGYEQQAKFFLQNRPDGLQADAVGNPDGSGFVFKRQQETVSLGRDSSGQPDGRGSRDGGDVPGGDVQLERIEPAQPAQRELFQSVGTPKPMFNLTQPLLLDEPVSLQNVQPVGDAIDLSAKGEAFAKQVAELKDDFLSSGFMNRLFSGEQDIEPFQYRDAVEVLAKGADAKAERTFKNIVGRLDKQVPRQPEVNEVPTSDGLVAVRADNLGFTTSAEKALFDPPPRFRDARNLTADQWRKYFREAGATKEAFEFMIEPALKTLPSKGDIAKADVIKAVRTQRPVTDTLAEKPWTEARIETDYRTYVSPGKHTNYQQELIIMPKAAQGYRSHNWKTRGVIGHIRTTDRVTTDGEAVRFVDELQSDLHQEGAKYGYKGDNDVNDLELRRETYKTARARYVKLREGEGSPNQAILPPANLIEYGQVKPSDVKTAEGRELARELLAAYENLNAKDLQPPRAPVKDWEKPFIRRVIQQAIEDGKDLVAFTNHKTLNHALQNEGTQKFYDDRLPAHIRKVAKDLGAKVERVSIGDGIQYEIRSKPAIEYVGRKKRKIKHYDVYELGEHLEDPRQWVKEFTSESEAKKFVKDARIKNDKEGRVLAIRITPEAKQKLAREGNALFQRQDNKPRASVLIPGDGVLSDPNTIVNLTKKADRTSFLHESAHIFLELYASLESENEVIAERMGAIRKWLKIEPGAKITRDQHEKFAESFEAYLMEGVAPSAELRGVFHQFRQWFVDVYRRLRGQLRNLEPEARDIFDRMLASDAEIEMAQGQYVGMISKAMEAIMTPEQVEKYQKHARKAGNVARDKLFKKHMAEVKRKHRAAYKEEQARVEDMVRAQMATWPEYRALNAFKDGARSLDASESPEGTKLNTSENGEHPEIVAPDMGFTSADEMFKAVEKAIDPETLVRESVKKIMGDKYGDMMRDGTIEAEAMEAVFNEPTIRMLEAERNAIAREAAKQRSGDKKRGVPSDAIPLAAIRQEAERLINSMPIDKVIKPGRYAIKARDLHKKALRAAAKGKWDDALRYTHQAMLQHELARKAFKAREEIEKANRYLAKFAAHRKLDPKKIAPEYIAKIRELIALAGSENQAESREKLVAFADSQDLEGYAVILPSDVVGGNDLPIRRRMTMEQFREYRDTVKNLNQLGRLQSEEAKEQFNAEAQALTDEIDANFKGKRIRETRNPTFAERRAANARQMDATIIRWPFLIESLQGGKVGKIVEAFDTRLRKALTNRNARRQDMADKLAEIFRKHGITQAELNKRVSAKAIEAGGVKFEQVMAVAMNMGTEQNRDRVASDPSLGGDMAAIDAMLKDHLEKRHWDAVQEIWDLINTLWPEASAVERNATGVTPKKVEASSVNTKFGAYRGGYYPLKYDRAFGANNDLKKRDEIEEWKNGVNGMATRASTPQGFLKERQQNVERPLDLSLGVILSHIDDVTNDIYMREPASYVSRLLNKNRVRGMIKETQGDEYLKTLETILKRTVTGTERPDTSFEKLLQTMRINASVAILGANVVTAGLAPISYVQTVIPQYGFKTVFAGVAEYYSNPIKNAKLIAEKSAFMRERQNTMTREAHELIRKSAGQTRYAKVQGAGYWLMATIEKHSVSGPVWIGVYNDAKARGLSEADAITEADRAVSTTQGSGLEIDQSVMQGGNEGLRLLSFMWGYVSGYYGTVRNDVVSEQGLKKLMPLLKHMVILNLVASMMEAFIRGGFGDEEDPYVMAVWQMMMRNTFGLIPGVSSAVSKYDSGPAAFQVGTSVTRATESWYKAGTQVYEDGEAEGETVRRAMLETAKAGGFLFGVPGTVQAMKVEKTLAEDDDPTFYEAIVSGPDDDN